jgi:hypothetical protein
VPLPAPLFIAGAEVGVYSQITRPDMDAGNNARKTVFTPPAAKQ